MALTLPYSSEEIAAVWPYMTPIERAEVEALVNELPIPDLALKECVQEAWSLVEPASPFIDGWHIDVICDHLQAVTFGQVPNLIINIPPRHMKSLLTNVFWFCWEWTFNPWTRWMFVSYSEGLLSATACVAAGSSTRPGIRRGGGISSAWRGTKTQKKRFDNTEGGYRLVTTFDGQEKVRADIATSLAIRGWGLVSSTDRQGIDWHICLADFPNCIASLQSYVS
jgi:hypothetical protein